MPALKRKKKKARRKPVIYREPELLKLDLGSGPRPAEGFEGRWQAFRVRYPLPRGAHRRLDRSDLLMSKQEAEELRARLEQAEKKIAALETAYLGIANQLGFGGARAGGAPR